LIYRYCNNLKQLLDTFLEFKELVQRPLIRRELESEGHTLMNHSKSSLQKLNTLLVATRITNNNNMAGSSEDSETLRKISLVQQLEFQVRYIQLRKKFNAILSAQNRTFYLEHKFYADVLNFIYFVMDM